MNNNKFSKIQNLVIGSISSLSMIGIYTGSVSLNDGINQVLNGTNTLTIGSKNLESLRTETATGYSFPSGHTQTATTVWVALIEYFRFV